MSAPWRVGRKLGRTIFRQEGPNPSDADPLIGVMDTREDARRVVDAVNAVARIREIHQPESGQDHSKCVECVEWWPCPTIRALGGDDD